MRPEYMETLTVALSEDIFMMLPDPCVSVRGLVAAEGLIRSPVCKTRIADPLANIVKVRDRRLTGFVRPATIPVLPIPMVIPARPDRERHVPPGCGSLPSLRLPEPVTSRSTVEMAALQGCEPLTAPSARTVVGCCRALVRRTGCGSSLSQPGQP